ncbi:MAG: hypothetical protein NTV38_08715 [Chloroflexi bacterium]|nr:hypothetical protein [Chloroflexota bacterium]
MNRIRLLFLGSITGIFLTFGFFWIGSLQNVLAKPSGTYQSDAATALVRLSNEPGMTETPSSAGGSDELPPDNLITGSISMSALPTPISGETLVYFITSDSDATATVLFLYNTDSVAHTVALRGYSYNGILGYSLNINIGAGSFVRLASDSIVAAPPPSWATPAPIITNFTDFTYFGSLSLPKGVKVEGYVLFDSGTGTVDPRLDQGAIPIRFSTDPATLFMPLMQTNP